MKRLLLIAIFLLTASCLLPPAASAQGTPGTVRYPTLLDTPDSLFRITDSASTRLSVAITSVSTSMTVDSTAIFPVSGSIKLDNEVIYYTSKTSTEFLGLVRGSAGTAASSHAVGAFVRAPILSAHHNTLVASLIAAQTKLGYGVGAPVLNSVLVGGTDAGSSTWSAQPAINCTNCTNLDAGDLSSGTIPDARFPATLPAANASNLTNLDAGDLNSGTIPDARFPATLPAANGSNLTSLDAGDLASGTIPDARFPATLPAGSGTNLTNLNPSSVVQTSSFRFVTDAEKATWNSGVAGPASAGPLLLTADSDNTGGADARIDFITGSGGSATTRFSMTDKLGVGISSPNSIIDVNTLPTAANNGATVLRLRTNQAGDSDFVINYTTFANSFGQTRRDNALSMGYNMNNQVPAEPTFGWVIESRYRTAEGSDQTEFYFTAGVPGFSEHRPFSIDLYHANGASQVAFTTNSIKFFDAALTQNWLHLTANTTSGTMSFLGDAGIVFSTGAGGGIRETMISHAGVGVLGMETDGEMFLGTSGGASHTVKLFRGAYPGGGVTLDFGGGGPGVRSSGSGPLQYYDNVSASWRSFNDELPSRTKMYRVERTLGTTAGDTVEIGTFITAANRQGKFEVSVTDNYPAGGAHYMVIRNGDDNGTNWYEVYPIAKSHRGGFAPYVLDVQPTDGNTMKMRLRRSSTGADTTSIEVQVVAYYGVDAANFSFTPTSATGTGATVSGAWGSFANIGGTFYLNDGDSREPVSFGAADSCGSGFRCVRIPN